MNQLLTELSNELEARRTAGALFKDIETRLEEFESQKNPGLVQEVEQKRKNALSQFALGKITQAEVDRVKKECARALTDQEDIDDILIALAAERSRLNTERGEYEPRIAALRSQCRRAQYQELIGKIQKSKAIDAIKELRAWAVRSGITEQHLVRDLCGQPVGDEIKDAIFKHADAEALGL